MNAFNNSTRSPAGFVSVNSTSSFSSSGFARTTGERVGRAGLVEEFFATSVESEAGVAIGEGPAVAAGCAGVSVGEATGVSEAAGCGFSTTAGEGEGVSAIAVGEGVALGVGVEVSLGRTVGLSTGVGI